MEGLTQLEQAVLDKCLAGNHPTLAALRMQAGRARVKERQETGVGFFVDFEVDASMPSVDGDFHIGDVHGEVSGLAHGVGFVLFVRSGQLSVLEGFTFDEQWPTSVASFELRYDQEPRRLLLPIPTNNEK